ncbi:MAG: RpiB/LacA/LacB family sugar-phosphate isomerase [Chloroflexi bacterium]|nr:RpiB/LacA/LacB family sugar-phosphate isomerase [Chloroflexota bacterium]
MKLAIAADHAGFPLKEHLVEYLRGQGHEVVDLGVDTDAVPADYPDIAELVAAKVLDGSVERGILAYGSGVGVSVAANKIPGIYCAITHDTYSAHQGVEHDKMNVMCIGARVVGPALANDLVDAFIKAQFTNEERHVRRFGKVQTIEQRYQNS